MERQRHQDVPPRRPENARRGHPLSSQAVRGKVRYKPQGGGAEQQRGTPTAWGKCSVEEEVLRAEAATVRYAYQWQRKQRGRRRYRERRPVAKAVSAFQES